VRLSFENSGHLDRDRYMVEYAVDASMYLYHYTSMSTAQKIVQSGALRLGRYRNTNDPKERKAWHFSVGAAVGTVLDPSTAQTMSDWLSAAIKSTARLACFSKDVGPLAGDNVKDINQRGFSRPRMWAQYGDDHKGVCLVFRVQDFLDATRSRFSDTTLRVFDEVQYVDRSVVPNLFSPDEQQYTIDLAAFESLGRDQYLLQHVAAHRHRLFFEKMTDWANEREWRYVAFDRDPGEVYVPFQDALAGIIFGEEVTAAAMNKLIQAAEQYKPWFMRLKWKNCSPWYDYENPMFRFQHR